MKCPNCNMELFGNPNFCTKCGAKFVYNGFTEYKSSKLDILLSFLKGFSFVVLPFVIIFIILFISQ